MKVSYIISILLTIIVFFILYQNYKETFVNSFKCRLNKKLCFGIDREFYNITLTELVKVNNELNKN